MEEECTETLLCIPFSEEELAEVKKYADFNEMGVEDFLKNVCLSHCLQQMAYFQGEIQETPQVGGGAARSEEEAKPEAKPEPRKVEAKAETKEKKVCPSSKDLLDGPLVLDQQCIMDLFAIKRAFGQASNNKIITVALKLGLNQLSVALDLLKHKLDEK